MKLISLTKVCINHVFIFCLFPKNFQGCLLMCLFFNIETIDTETESEKEVDDDSNTASPMEGTFHSVD